MTADEKLEVVQGLLELNRDPTWTLQAITTLLHPDASTPSEVTERRERLAAQAEKAAKDLERRVAAETEQAEREDQRRKDREAEIATAEREIDALFKLKPEADPVEIDPLEPTPDPAPVEP